MKGTRLDAAFPLKYEQTLVKIDRLEAYPRPTDASTKAISSAERS